MGVTIRIAGVLRVDSQSGQKGCAMDPKSLDRLQHRCGTCGEIFKSIEELCEHAQVHARATDEQSEPASATYYRYDHYSVSFEDRVEDLHRLHRGRAVKVQLPDEC